MPKNKKDEKHVINFRVYYEDTDAGGVMYHASHLRFAERARTEMLRFVGYNQSEMRAKQNLFFVVRFIEAEYLKPIFLDDVIHVYSCVEKLSNTSMIINQVFKRGEDVVSQIRVVVICVNGKMKPAAIPRNLYDRLVEKGCPTGKIAKAS